ncbi:Protein SRT-23 [Aphelenchoides avenae]|nr:Protein SRT-23 [Aphelenchus avenae]
MWSPNLCRKTFAGNRTWAWLAIPTLCAAYFCVWTKPITFSGLYLSWFFNPHVGYIDDGSSVYENFPHSVHNLIVLFALTGIYTVFSIGFYVRTRTLDPTQRSASSQKAVGWIFIQVLLISAFNAIGSAIYAYMQYVHLNEALIIVAQFCWLFAHGLPSVVYLTMNKTVRRKVRQMLSLLTFTSQITNADTTAFTGVEVNRSVASGVNPAGLAKRQHL